MIITTKPTRQILHKPPNSTTSITAEENPFGLYLAEIKGKGQGVFTQKHIATGTTVLTFAGEVIKAEQILDEERCLQISLEEFLTPSGGFDDFVNHSCNPNTGLVLKNKEMSLRALREIKTGEEITFDYSTETNLGDNWTMQCCCGATNCRGIIGEWDFLPQAIKQYYLKEQVVPGHVLELAKRHGRCGG